MNSKVLNERQPTEEKHNEGLAKHFGHDNTFSQLRNSYYWPSMRA
jgi:hypothetical protein